MEKVKKNQINQILYPNKELTSILRTEADKNPAFSSVCHLFAARERSRRQITLRSLTINMQRQGFSYDKGQYARILRFLASTGVGILDFDRNNKLRSLKDINVALPAIAIAALSENHEEVEEIKVPVKIPVKVPAKKEATTLATFTVSIDGATLTIKMPQADATKYLMAMISDTSHAAH